MLIQNLGYILLQTYITSFLSHSSQVMALHVAHKMNEHFGTRVTSTHIFFSQNTLYTSKHNTPKKMLFVK
jgi:hypothetical protein